MKYSLLIFFISASLNSHAQISENNNIEDILIINTEEVIADDMIFYSPIQFKKIKNHYFS